MSTSGSSLYSLTSTVPLIKSPSIRLPSSISFPQDLHPLPPDISAYFVYPFSLESYVLSENSPNSETISALHSKHVEYLNFRKSEKERLRREEIRRLAPGWKDRSEQDGEDEGILKPDIKGKIGEGLNGNDGFKEEGKEMVKEQRNVMDDLVDHLASLDSQASEQTTSFNYNLSSVPSFGSQSSQLPPPPAATSTSWGGSA